MSDGEENIPDRDTCQKLTEEFAKITDTNEALAQTFLQDHEWKLEPSLNAFYEALQKENGSEVTVKTDQETIEKLFGEGKCVTSTPPPVLKFMTWNLDGLDEHNLKKRTRAVIKHVQLHEPDVIFFQEVINESCDYLELKLPEYHSVRGNDDGYFTLTMLRVFTVFYDKHEILPYPTSTMGRNLLVTDAHMGKLKLKLFNTHLESTKDHSQERVKQLKFVFNKMVKCENDEVVIFGGDLNLRDKELELAGGIPNSVQDMWVYCGSRKEFQFTWDMTRNYNHSIPGKFKPRCRFDRVYVRNSQPGRVVPKHFVLIGAEKVPQTTTFPSDHWGIVVVFDVNHSI